MTRRAGSGRRAAARPVGRAGRHAWRASALLAVPVLVIAGLLTLALGSPDLAARVPGLPALLRGAAGFLPANVAWIYDHGSPSLRPGAYFGWSDGRRGELLLYGSGCSLAEGNGGGDTLVSLRLGGPAGTLEVGGADVEHLSGALDLAAPHPYLRVNVRASSTLDFDRVSLRCRSGAEASARIAARVAHVSTPARASELWEARVLMLVGPDSLPGIGMVAELGLGAGDSGMVVAALEYAPPSALGDGVIAAFGRNANVPLWRSLVYGERPGLSYLDPASLTPWDESYQSPSDPGLPARRPAAALDLPVGPGGAASLYLDAAAFLVTPEPRPILSTPLLYYVLDGTEGVATTDGPAFGWTGPARGPW